MRPCHAILLSAVVIHTAIFGAALRISPQCNRIVEGCESTLEIKDETGACVMAHTLPQYPIGSSIDKTIANFEKMFSAYYKDISALEAKMDMSEKGFEILTSKLRNALQHTKKFVVSAIGSSVVAGHDNCQVDAYPEQLYHLLAPLFKQAGIDFEARNGGITGTCGDMWANQPYCVESIGGSDADVTQIHWDYFYMPESAQEIFIRASLSMPKQPMPMFWTLVGLPPKDDPLLKKYADYGYHALGAGKTKEICSGWHCVGDGEHLESRIGRMYPVNHCRRQSTAELMRNWHGGPLMYQLVSDVMGWTYVKALKAALSMKENVSQSLLQKVELPSGIATNLASSPRCAYFNKVNFAGNRAIKLLDAGADPSSLISQVETGGGMIPEAERGEAACLHPDSCGSVAGKAAFDLQAQYKEPLVEGKLVICFKSKVPCGSTVTVDGKTYTDGDAEELKPPARKHCGVYNLANKNAKHLTIDGTCSVTHIIAY